MYTMRVKFWMLWIVLYTNGMQDASDPHTWNLPRVTS